MRSLKSSFATQFTTQNCEVEILFDHFAELIFAEKGSKIFEKSLFKMDFNDVLLQSFFIYGRYDSKTMHKSKALVYMNNFIVLHPQNGGHHSGALGPNRDRSLFDRSLHRQRVSLVSVFNSLPVQIVERRRRRTKGVLQIKNHNGQ